MSSVIRKISIGADYKNEAMHYAVSQQVYGGHIICNILHNEHDGSYNIYIKRMMKFFLGKSSILIWRFQ